MKKFFLTLSFLFLYAVSVFALPGVSHYLSDLSGEYVYYRDYSFNSETIVGFLFYDKGTFAARYYSPADIQKDHKEKDITVYLTINPDKDYLEFTGEKIIGGTPAEDSEIINYLHDLAYEFTSRRQKVQIAADPVEVKQEYEQFGGEVTINFDSFIPMFNIESITGSDGICLFSVETVGIITSSSDTAFADFKGVEGLPKDKKREFKKSKKAKPVEAVFENQTLTVDDEWKQSMENLWLLNDSALIAFAKIPVDSKRDKESIRHTLVRKMIEGSSRSYSVWPMRKIEYNEKSTIVMSVFYQTDTENVTRDFKILTDTPDGFYLVTLTVFEGIYQNNKKYFDSIIKSYKVK